MSLERQGVKLLFSNALEIEKKLIEMELEKNSKENKEANNEKDKKTESVINTLKKVQKEFEGVAEEAGLKNEDDVQKLLDENK